MDPGEEGAVLLADPGRGGCRHRVAAAFRLECAHARRAPFDRVVVDVEAAAQAEAAVEHVGADERAGREAAGLEPRGERAVRCGKHVDTVVVDAVM